MKIEIIPAIDLIDGKCVRLTRGDYNLKKVYGGDPLEVARRYEEIGIRRLHLVDLDGAKAARPENLATLEKIASGTSLDIQYGGGIKNSEALASVFSAGASRAICGSIAITAPERFEEWLAKFGPARMILGADTRAGKVAINGWLEESETGISTVITRFAGRGLSQVICTDIERDGMLTSPNFGLYEELGSEFPGIEITASGGISGMGDIERLDETGIRSVIVGKAIYEKRITLKQLEKCLQNE